MKETRIPTRADMPPYLLVWSSDECMPVLLGLGIGIMLNQVFICTTVGLIVAHFYRKFRDLHPDGYLFHLLYWYGFGFTRSKSMINPWIKRLIP